MLLSLHLSNTLAKNDSTKGNGMSRISFLATDNWLKSFKYGILIGLNQFYPRMPQVLLIMALKAQIIEPIGQNLVLCKFRENLYVSYASYL